MSDWVDDLSEDERAGWDEFVDRFRRDAMEKIVGSSSFVTLFHGNVDVKNATELGAAILLDKPILVVAPPDTKIPLNLRRVAREIVFADVDTQEGQERIHEAFRRFLK